MKNIFDAIPEKLESEIFESLVESRNVQIERIISKGQASPDNGWYDQDKNEWVLVVKGEAVLAFAEGPTVTLKPGDYINIAAHRKHKVKWTAPEAETIWLAVHY